MSSSSLLGAASSAATAAALSPPLTPPPNPSHPLHATHLPISIPFLISPPSLSGAASSAATAAAAKIVLGAAGVTPQALSEQKSIDIGGWLVDLTMLSSSPWPYSHMHPVSFHFHSHSLPCLQLVCNPDLFLITSSYLSLSTLSEQQSPTSFAYDDWSSQAVRKSKWRDQRSSNP